MQPEIRKDNLTKKTVIIAPKRSERPNDIKKTKKKNNAKCPLCPNNISAEIKDQINRGKNWQVLCLDNPFPAVSTESKKAYGIQEVIVETPIHNKDLGELTIDEIIQVLKMHARRTAELSQNKKINFILCLKNKGPMSGASLTHSHSQVFATQILPPDVKEELILAKKYKKKNKTCFYCDLIKSERKSKKNIWSDKNIIAFTPNASQYNYEVWIFSNRHVDNITQLNKNELESLAKILKKLLTKIEKLNLSYNFFFHQVISDSNQHFCLKIQPRGNTFGGVELGSGIVINSVSPEDAAKYFRK